MFSGSISTNSCQMLYVPFEQKVIQPAVEYFKIHFRNASADPWSSFMKGTKGGSTTFNTNICLKYAIFVFIFVNPIFLKI